MYSVTILINRDCIICFARLEKMGSIEWNGCFNDFESVHLEVVEIHYFSQVLLYDRSNTQFFFFFTQ